MLRASLARRLHSMARATGTMSLEEATGPAGLTRDEVVYDPFDARRSQDPYPLFRRLRDRAPVHHSPSSGVFVVSRYRDVREVLTAPERFSSDAMMSTFLGIRPGADPAQSPEMASELMALAEELPFELSELLSARVLIASDAPKHTSIRRLAHECFTPRRVARYEPMIRRIAEGCVDEAVGRGRFDLVTDVAMPISVRIIASLLGVEADRYVEFKRWSDDIIRGLTGSGREKGFAKSGFAHGMGSLSRLLLDVVRERRLQPREDPIGLLVRAQQDGAELRDAEIVNLGLLLLVAGHEAVTNLIGNSVNALLDHPDQLERVCADPSLLPATVEESLRYESPNQLVFRRATRAGDLRGVVVPKDATIVALIGSANRDERYFEDPDRFDVLRKGPRHIAFGFGHHFCLGATLGRLEGRVALETLAPHLPKLAKLDDDVTYVDSIMMRGPKHLHLTRT